MEAMRTETKKTVDVIIPVYRPGSLFGRLLARLEKQTWPIRKIILINTGEEFWNPDFTEGLENVELHHVTREEFDHGGTRNLGAFYSEADVMVFMTDDAMPKDRYLIERLVTALYGDGLAGEPASERAMKQAGNQSPERAVGQAGEPAPERAVGQAENQSPERAVGQAGEPARDRVALAYARQLPRAGGGPIESYARSFNYPPCSRIKTAKDLPELGIKTYFASNVCCAYDRAIFCELGGFINRTVFNEDMIYAAKAVNAGYALAYAANAQVIHSHRYGLIQQFRRNFDLGVSQADHPEVFRRVSSEREGARLVSRTARFLAGEGKPWLIPYLIISSGFKYLGYRCGRGYRRLPKRLVFCFTMNHAYWRYRPSAAAKGGAGQ